MFVKLDENLKNFIDICKKMSNDFFTIKIMLL